MFVAEYRSILADKLLQNLQYSSDQEVATLELLKIRYLPLPYSLCHLFSLRFGEEALHSCEVMMHDLEGSKRVNIAVTERIAAAVFILYMMLCNLKRIVISRCIQEPLKVKELPSIVFSYRATTGPLCSPNH